MARPLRLLLVEDNPGDVVLVRQALRDAATDVELTHVSSLEASRQALQQSPDAVLLDLNLPDSTGVATVPAVRALAPRTPLIVFTGLADERTGLEAVRLGAQDYLVKGAIDAARMMQAVRYAIERQHAEDNLLATAAALEASNRALDEFASIASHDLRDPLAKILALSNLLCAGEPTASPEDRETLREIHRSARRMKHLVDALLGYARAVRPAPRFDAVALDTVAAEVMTDLQVRVTETSARVVVGSLPVVRGDIVLLRQLLQNLVANALKCAHPDRPLVVTIDASVDTATRMATLRVHDNGRGFDPADALRIFKPFVQLEDARGDGSGLGLAICRRIVEAHRGELTAEARAGLGATFSFTVPLQGQDAGEGVSHARRQQGEQ